VLLAQADGDSRGWFMGLGTGVERLPDTLYDICMIDDRYYSAILGVL
jgi:hypothetical protein